VRDILFFGSFWSSLLWLLFLDCRHSFVNLFPHFFWSLAFDFIFFSFLQIDRSRMMPFCSQGARDPECAARLGKRAPSKWESTPSQRGKNANRGGAARSSMFTGLDFWKRFAPMYLPSSYVCPGQRRNVCAALSMRMRQERKTQKRAAMASGTVTVVASTSRGRPDVFSAHAALHGDLRNRVSDDRRQRFANDRRIRFPDFG
jgi:hypothetical protein